MANKQRSQVYYEKWINIFAVAMVVPYVLMLLLWKFGASLLFIQLLGLPLLISAGGIIWAVRKFTAFEKKGGVVKFR